jgi:alpha-amylase
MQNGTMLQYFHWYTPADGNLWKQIKNEAAQISEMGINAVWLPPAYKASAGGYSVGYDVYDIYDLGEFDQKGSVRTKYGTKQEYLDAIKALKENGIAVYVDIVLNHMAGADETEKVSVLKVNDDNRLEVISEPHEIEAYTKFTFPGRHKNYSEFIWDKNCFTGIDYAHDTGETAIYSILNEYGDGWEDMVDDEKGNYDYLMYADVEFRNPQVREELKRWAEWYWHQTQFDGVRLDAVKHIPPQFYNEWLDHLRSFTNKQIFAVGEYWAPGNLSLLQKYIDATEGRMSVFDSSLHHNLHAASKAGKDYDMSTILENTLTSVNPSLSVPVVENHDTQPLQALEAPVEPWFKPLAYALILLRQEGYPCIFHPDLTGATYTDKGSDGNEYEIHIPESKHLKKLIGLRKTHAYGLQRNYFDHGNCIGWTREGIDEIEKSGLVVIMSNGEGGNKQMEVGAKHAGKTFIDALQETDAKVVVNEKGTGEFFCNAGSVSVWVEE